MYSTMKSPGKCVCEPVGVLERVVHLGVGHRPGVEPHVEDVRDAPHRRLAGRVVGVGPGQLVDVGPVQVVRPHAEVALQLVEAAVHVDARIGRIVGHPHRNRRAPVAVSGDRPVAGARQPLAELAVLDVLGIPGDLLVELDHPVAELGDLDEPRRHRPVDQRIAAAPAVRVGVLVGLVPHQHRRVDRRRPGAVLEVADDLRVGVEDVLALVVRHRGVEAALGVDRRDRHDADGVGGRLVVLAVGRRHVHDAGAVLGGDEVAAQHLKSVGGVREVRERRQVAQAEQLLAGAGGQDLRVLPQLAGVGGQPRLRQHERRSVRPARPHTSTSGLTATAWLDGSVHGVVVQTSR